MHPVIKAERVEYTRHPDGRVDAKVIMPKMALRKALGDAKAEEVIRATEGKVISPES